MRERETGRVRKIEVVSGSEKEGQVRDAKSLPWHREITAAG